MDDIGAATETWDAFFRADFDDLVRTETDLATVEEGNAHIKKLDEVRELLEKKLESGKVRDLERHCSEQPDRRTPTFGEAAPLREVP